MSTARMVLAGLVAVASACVPRASRAGFDRVPFAPPLVVGQGQPSGESEAAPALRYAALDRDACEYELNRRGIAHLALDNVPGVLAPVRLDGPLHGVVFRTTLTEVQRASSAWEIVDCRLVLALDDFAVQLAAHDVVVVVHYSMYRPPSQAWPRDRVASRHPGGLAIDAASFIKRDRRTLTVERDFHGHIGAVTCGGGASTPQPATPEAIELRQIVCDAGGARLFNVALTPNYNWAHRNHLHLEVTPRAHWFLVH